MRFSRIGQWVDFAFLLFLSIWGLAVIVALIDWYLR